MFHIISLQGATIPTYAGSRTDRSCPRSAARPAPQPHPTLCWQPRTSPAGSNPSEVSPDPCFRYTDIEDTSWARAHSDLTPRSFELAIPRLGIRVRLLCWLPARCPKPTGFTPPPPRKPHTPHHMMRGHHGSATSREDCIQLSAHARTMRHVTTCNGVTFNDHRARAARRMSPDKACHPATAPA